MRRDVSHSIGAAVFTVLVPRRRNVAALCLCVSVALFAACRAWACSDISGTGGPALTDCGDDRIPVPQQQRSAPQRRVFVGGGGGGNRAAAMIGVAGALLGAMGSIQRHNEQREQELRDEQESQRLAQFWRDYAENTRRSWCEGLNNRNEAGREALRQGDFERARREFETALEDNDICKNEAARQVILSNLALLDRAEAAAQRIKEAREREVQQQRACQAARAEHDNANVAMRALQPADAIGRYTAAIADFQTCGQPNNVEVARHNLALAQRLRTVLLEEAGRFDEAQRKFGSSSPYADDNPFANGADERIPQTERATVNLDAGNLYGEAAKMCEASVAKDTDGWAPCMRYAQAAVIQKYDPEVAGYCTAVRETEARVDCTINRYANTLAGRVRLVKAKAEENVYEGIFDRKRARSKPSALRQRLRDMLNQDEAGATPEAPASAATPATNSGSAMAPGTTAPGVRATSKTTQEEILDGLPQYTSRGKLPPAPLAGGSGLSE